MIQENYFKDEAENLNKITFNLSQKYLITNESLKMKQIQLFILNLPQDLSKTQILIEILKNFQISNWQACYLNKSAHADKRIREIRKTPPEGYKLVQIDMPPIKGYCNTTYLNFKLEREM